MVGITLFIIVSILLYSEIQPLFMKQNLYENPGNIKCEVHRFNL